MADWLQAQQLSGCEVLTDFQLQIEHALDLQKRQQIWFVDAAINLDKAFTIQSLKPQKDDTISSHALSPQALLQVYQSTFKQAAPAAKLLSIGGYQFELGCPLTEQAEINLQQARKFLLNSLYK